MRDTLYPDLTLSQLEKLVKDYLALSDAQTRYDIRQEPVKFQISSDLRQVVVAGKKRQNYYVVETVKIQDNALVLVITREFEEIEGFDGRK